MSRCTWALLAWAFCASGLQPPDSFAQPKDAAVPEQSAATPVPVPVPTPAPALQTAGNAVVSSERVALPQAALDRLLHLLETAPSWAQGQPGGTVFVSSGPAAWHFKLSGTQGHLQLALRLSTYQADHADGIAALAPVPAGAAPDLPLRYAMPPAQVEQLRAYLAQQQIDFKLESFATGAPALLQRQHTDGVVSLPAAAAGSAQMGALLRWLLLQLLPPVSAIQIDSRLPSL